MKVGGNTTGNQKQNFRNRVWAILSQDHHDIYVQAQEHKTEIDALIDQGNENLWDKESVAHAVTQGFAE